MRFTRMWAGGVSAVVVAGLALGGPASGQSLASGADEQRSAVTPLGTVTLITGDQVSLAESGGRMSAQVRTGPGREGVAFLARQVKNRFVVIPSDAGGLLGTRRVDERLFDVKGLLDMGYGDDKRGDVPLIVEGVGGAAVAGATHYGDVGVSVVRPAKNSVGALWTELRDGRSGGRVWLDGVIKRELKESVPQIGAPTLWKDGFTGEGVTVAVLDGAVDTKHPDLAGRIKESRDFTGEPEPAGDVHGTHVATTVLGSGAASNGDYRGVAPGAKLIAGQVCSERGCPESAILAGMQWAAQSGAKAINMSLGGADGLGLNPLEIAVNKLSEKYGALFVIAAGNAGYNQTIGSPGSADAALTVGAVDKQDNLAGFSSRGPRVGDGAIKPDITAPGVEITAGVPGGKYASLNGTSMATPHVTGAVALLAQQHPDWSATRIKSALIASAKPTPGANAFDQGSGRIDVPKAAATTVLAEPPSVSMGIAQWPHDDDKDITKQITYRNTGKTPVTLGLKLDSDTPGVFSLSADKVTVPAGGTANVTVTAVTKSDIPDGFYSAQVGAYAEGVEVRTAVGVTKEPEAYDLVVDAKTRKGGPGSLTSVVVPTDSSTFYYVDQVGTHAQTLRVPKGDYIVDGLVTEEGQTSYLVEPKLTVAGATKRTFDARQAKPVGVSYEDRNVRPSGAILKVFVPGDPYVVVTAAYATSFTGLNSGLIGTAPPGLESALFGQYTKKVREVQHEYHSAWWVEGSVVGSLNVKLNDRNQATVNTSVFSDPGPGDRILYTVAAHPKGALGYDEIFGGPITAPLSKVVHYNTTAPWYDYYLREREPNRYATVFSGLRRFKAGERKTETYNHAVRGPAFTSGKDVTRSGDRITARVGPSDNTIGHSGSDAPIEARSALYKGTELVAESPRASLTVDVPAGAADYRLEQTVVADQAPALSTKLETAWTFRSDTSTGPLPLQVLRFSPTVDKNNRATAGASNTIAITVQRQTEGESKSLKLELSTDDGKTWTPVTVSAAGKDRFTAVTTNPAANTAVALRATAVDSSGSTVTQTIHRAYTT